MTEVDTCIKYLKWALEQAETLGQYKTSSSSMDMITRNLIENIDHAKAVAERILRNGI